MSKRVANKKGALGARNGRTNRIQRARKYFRRGMKMKAERQKAAESLADRLMKGAKPKKVSVVDRVKRLFSRRSG